MADAVRKSCLTKLNNIYVAAHSTTTPLTQISANDFLRQVELIMTRCTDAHFAAIEKCTDDAAIKTQDDAQTPIEAAAHKVRCKLQEILIATQSSGTAGGSTPRAVSINLPSLELPIFDGSFANWTSFKDLFLATVDKHPGLSPAQKLQYLRGKLAEEPANLIKSLLITDGNYKEAWTLLNARYNNNREIVYSWIDKLIHHPKPLQHESAQGLQSLLDNTNECLRALQVLQIDIKSWDHIIISVLLKKVDANTRCEWATRHYSTNLPTLVDFSTFLSNHIRGLIAKGGATSASNTQQRRQGNQIKSHFTTTSLSCRICKGPHLIYKCDEFISKSPNERSELARKHHLCFNCLSHKHRKQDCESKSRCRRCNKGHHTLLHEESPPPFNPSRVNGGNAQQQGNGGSSVSTHTHHTISNEKSQVLLSTAIVMIGDQYGGKQPCRAFLDSGSQASFISEDCVRRLGIRRLHSRITVSGISASAAGSTHGKVEVQLHSQYHGPQPVDMQLHILSKVTGLLPKVKCCRLDWAHIRDLPLADKEYHQPQKVDVLIGADYMGQVIVEGQRQAPSHDAPFAQNTIFGWILCGRAPVASYPTILVNHVTTDMDILRKFWEVEEPPRARILTKEEKECEVHFRSTYNRDATGRFTVAIPFNNKRAALGSSKATAHRRFLQVEKRLHRQPEFRQQYQSFMKEYLELGHMEGIPSGEDEYSQVSTFYLPHHFVINESSSTTKLRVVFDGSVKSSTGVSLNDAMYVGATLQDELYFLLLRFRTHPVVLKADITKMFRQFRLTNEDSDMHRILWRETSDQPLKEFRLTTVTYGTACAPNLSTRCLQQLAMDVKDKYPHASHSLLNETYVDDVMSGAPTERKAIQLYEELVQAASTACLDLRKWSSNSTAVLAHIPPEHQETNPHTFDDGATVKALGVQWDPATDAFKFQHIPITVCDILTKRILLSDLARVFDPLGLIACVTVRAKLLLQELWKIASGWDDPVPDFIQQQWNAYQDDMRSIDRINIPRCILPNPNSELQLHGFSDASEAAYGAVIYLRVKTEDSAEARLITSKTRVAPLRQITLPRLELMAALLLAELISEVQEGLKLSCPIYLWTDSTITLRWISSQPRRWKTFVANRVARIQECTPIDCWRHVPGVENPADLASRGITVTELASSPFWLSGPDWLTNVDLPTFPQPIAPECYANEERSVPHLVHSTFLNFPIIERFSSLLRLQRVTAHIFRLFFNSKKGNILHRKTGPLSAEEVRCALLHWVKEVQRNCYATEISFLEKTARVQPSSKLCNLHPFLDKYGFLRLSGRLHHCHAPEDQKHQLIIPADSHLTTLIIRHHHQQTLHGGFQITWSSILDQFWIPGGRDKVRFIARSCVICRRQKAKSAVQLMGSLPAPRVTASRPFSHTGVDYAGPFILKNPIGRAPKTYKGYFCIFVCMATKAIHLEPVSSLTTQDFIATLRRFSSRRGFPSHMYSDQGTNFVGADRELKQLIAQVQSSSAIPDQLSASNITWHWNPPTGAHADFAVLTPGHFLIGDPLIAIPDANLTKIPSNRLNIFQQQQQRIQLFWNRWSKDYLNTLQQRNKWWWDRPNLKEGDLVLMIEESSPGTWKLARIQKVHPGDDGKVRVVTLMTASKSTFQRPIVKLIPLFRNDN